MTDCGRRRGCDCCRGGCRGGRGGCGCDSDRGGTEGGFLSGSGGLIGRGSGSVCSAFLGDLLLLGSSSSSVGDRDRVSDRGCLIDLDFDRWVDIEPPADETSPISLLDIPNIAISSRSSSVGGVD